MKMKRLVIIFGGLFIFLIIGSLLLATMTSIYSYNENKAQNEAIEKYNQESKNNN